MRIGRLLYGDCSSVVRILDCESGDEGSTPSFHPKIKSSQVSHPCINRYKEE